MQMRKKTLLIIGLLCLALTLCACSNEKKQYLGTWKLTKMVSGGTVFTVAEAQKLNGGDQSGEIIFKRGSIAKVKLRGSTARCKWKLKDGNVLITDSETTMQATLEKQQLKLIDNDTVLIFEKQ